MLQVRSLILYFFLLVLRILLSLGPDAGHNQDRLSRTLSEKSFEFVPTKESSTIAIKLNLVLLAVKIDLVLKKQSRQGHALRARSTGRIQIIFALPTKVVVFYMGTSIIQVDIPGLESSISGSGVC